MCDESLLKWPSVQLNGVKVLSPKSSAVFVVGLVDIMGYGVQIRVKVRELRG